MCTERECIQLHYHDFQTPCFKAAGAVPCDENTCRVFEMVRLVSAMTGEKVTYGELYQLCHDFCVWSNMNGDSSKFTQRVSERIRQGEL